jgi:hypothetical protein
MEFKDDGGEPLWVVSDDLLFLLAELDPSEQTKQQAAPGSDPELRSSIGSTQVRILQILKSSTTVTSFTLRDDE